VSGVHVCVPNVFLCVYTGGRLGLFFVPSPLECLVSVCERHGGALAKGSALVGGLQCARSVQLFLEARGPPGHAVVTELVRRCVCLGGGGTGVGLGVGVYIHTHIHTHTHTYIHTHTHTHTHIHKFVCVCVCVCV
jgi:hypothetical protein